MINDYFKRSISVYDGLYYANLMKNEEFRESLLIEDFNRRQVKDTLNKHMMEAEDGFVEACCRLLTN